MSKDFKASQIRTNKIIASGSSKDNPGILIYSASAASDFAGNVSPTLLSEVGSDVFFFVSGAKDSKIAKGHTPASSERAVALFGGDVVVSGTLYMDKLVAELDMTTTGSVAISGSLFISQSAEIQSGIVVNSMAGNLEKDSLTVMGQSTTSNLFKANVTNNTITFLSGAGNDSPTDHDQIASSDTSFYVSGAIHSMGTTSRGTSVFGGDVVISGSLTDGMGNLIGPAVSYFTSSEPGSIYTTGAVAFVGPSLSYGNASNIDSPSVVGSDIFFFVSGSTSTMGTSVTGSALFGGDLIVSGGFKQGESKVSGEYAVAFGSGDAQGDYTFAHGVNSEAQQIGAHSEGLNSVAVGQYSHAEGSETRAEAQWAHSEGGNTKAYGIGSHTEGQFTTSSGGYSHAEGIGTFAQGSASHAEGRRSLAQGLYSHAEGLQTTASNWYSHAEGEHTKASGQSAHAEGYYSIASALGSHAEGRGAHAHGQFSHAEGYGTWAKSNYSHAEGYHTTASGEYSHTRGYKTDAVGQYSHASGYETIASGTAQTVVGRYNKKENSDSLFIVGGGIDNASREDRFIVNRDNVLIGSSSVGNDVHLFVSGAQGNRAGLYGGLTKGTTVLGGDIAVSGTLWGTNQNYAGDGAPDALLVKTGKWVGIEFVGGPSTFVGRENFDNGIAPAGQVATDSFFYVSGGIGSKDVANSSAVSVFGGDVVISGALHGGSPLQIGAYRNNQGTDVSLWVSGAIGKRGSLEEGASVFGGDTVISGNLWGAKKDTSSDFMRLDAAADAFSFGRDPNHSVGSEVFFFVSGNAPVGSDPNPNVALFGGRLISSGNINVVQNYPATGAHLALNNMSQVLGSGGSTAIELVSGWSLQDGDATKLSITKHGPNNPQMWGGPYANIIQGRSGSIVLMVGSDETYVGNQPIALSDVHGTSYLATTGSHALGNARIVILSGGAGSSPNLVGADTNFVVSGAIGSNGIVSPNIGTALFGGDLVASGSIVSKNGLTGSLTSLSDGSEYILAGEGITVATSSAGQITISAPGAGGGSISTVSGSTSVGSVTSIDFTRFGLLQDLGGGSVALTGTIGPSEDGSYADGLFSSFDSETPIGTAIDKINEVLYYLSPSPAPNLSQISHDALVGSTALLSLGSTSGAGSSGYTVVADTAGMGSEVDINETYAANISNASGIRLGIFTSLQEFTGTLASNVTENAYVNSVVNYSGSTFGDADQGTLSLYINGSEVKTVNLDDQNVGTGDPGFGTDQQVDGNNNGFIELSQTGSAVQSNGQPFGLFKNRTGKFKVSTGGGYQRQGWNYARVVHTVNSVARTTNYVEWFVDNAGVAPNENKTMIASADVILSGSKFISGILYATGAHGVYRSRIDNFYDHVYQLNPISFATSNTDEIANQTIPTLDTAGGSYSNSINLSAKFQLSEASINAGSLASGSVTFNYSVAHPTKTNMVNTGSLVSHEFLVYSASQLSTQYFEDFVYEDHATSAQARLLSGGYTSHSEVNTAHSVGWNSSYHLTSTLNANAQQDGLMYYKGKLVSPSQSTSNGGNFTIFQDSYNQSAENHTQPDYSGETGKTKTWFRAFRNWTGSTVDNFSLTLTGSTTIVPAGTNLDASKIRVFYKNPGVTGWLDIASPFVHGQGSTGFLARDYDGGYIGTFNSSVPGSAVTNYGTFGTGSVGIGNFIVIKIEADDSWTGNLEGLNIIPDVVGSVSSAPALDELDISQPGTFYSGKLSFGPSGPAGAFGYTYVTGADAAGPFGYGANVTYNGDYNAAVSVGSNKRYGIVSTNGGGSSIRGYLNGDVSANGDNYSADAWRNAHTGTLELYVNQSGSGVSPIHSVDLASLVGTGNPGSGTGTSLNGNGSGFANISIATPGKDSDGLPDFNYFYRTATFIVDPDDQNLKGWNWAQVIHKVEGVPDEVTTFVEWVNDNDGDAIDIVEGTSGSFGAASYYEQSGVKYFDTAISPVATGTVKYRVSDAYTDVYSNSSTALQFTTLDNFSAQGIFVTGSSVVDKGDISLTSNGTTLPQLDPSGDIRDDIFVTGTLSYTGGTSLPGDASPLSSLTSVSPRATLTADHPIDTNDTSAVVVYNFLAYSGSAGSSNKNDTELFSGEFFRLQSGSYANQDASGSMKWNSSESLVGADAGHNSGLIVYGSIPGSGKGYLLSPKNSALPNSGKFTPFNDLTSPVDNVDYSSASGERHFFRAFKNNTTSDQAVISLTVKGDATLVPRTGAGSGTLGANKNVWLMVKIPGKTGWLDVGKAADGTITDGGGALQGDRDSTIDSSGAINEVTFSTAFVGGDVASDGSGEYFMLAIHADSDWTGYISEILVSF